jgi:hypothetical protein
MQVSTAFMSGGFLNRVSQVRILPGALSASSPSTD